MKNRKWVKEDDRNILYFTPGIFPHKEIRLAEIYSEDGDRYYSSVLLDVDREYLGGNSLEDAKEDVENMIENHYESEINYYKEMLKKFLEEK